MIRHAIAIAALWLAGLALTLPADAQAREYEEARVDMSAKSRTCKAGMARIEGATECFRTCANNARTLQNSTGLAADAVAAMQADCDALYAVAQQGEAVAPPAAPDYAGRAAALPAKAAYCRQAEASMGCPVDPSEPNWVKREQMCNTARGCSRCDDAGLVSRLTSNPVSRDVMMLNRCEENHGLVKDWLDG